MCFCAQKSLTGECADYLGKHSFLCYYDCLGYHDYLWNPQCRFDIESPYHKSCLLHAAHHLKFLPFVSS